MFLFQLLLQLKIMVHSPDGFATGKNCLKDILLKTMCGHSDFGPRRASDATNIPIAERSALAECSALADAECLAFAEYQRFLLQL